MYRFRRRLLHSGACLALAPLLAITTACTGGDPQGATEADAVVDERGSLLSRVLPTRQESLEVPAGTHFAVAFDQTLSSETAAAGDTFTASVTEGVTVAERVAIPAGSVIRGTVTEVVPPRKIGGQSKLTLSFHSLELPGGTMKPISALMALEGRDDSGRDAATIAGGALGGAVLGRVIGGGDRKKRTLLGLAIGAAAGTAIAASREGEPVVIPEDTVVQLYLEEAVTVPVGG